MSDNETDYASVEDTLCMQGTPSNENSWQQA